MKKSLIFLGVLSIGHAYAQRGNFGLNTTSPSATLEIKVADINGNNNTNQGIIIPKLTKERVAKIANTNLIQGTLVYIEDPNASITNTNPKVTQITKNGFYHYDGTNWVSGVGNTVVSSLPSGDINGQVLKWNGNQWIAQTDNNTTYTAGNGITLNGTQFSVPITTNGTGTYVKNIVQNSNGITVTMDTPPNTNNNIYNTNGSTNGDRTLDTASGFLTIKGNVWNPLVVNSEIVPANADNTARGGLAVHPNDITKRVEFATTKDGDSRIWADGDRLFIKRNTGNIGIGNTNPKAKLDVAGGIRSKQGLPNGDDTNLGYAFGNDGDTGLFSEENTTNSNVGKSLNLYLNNQNRLKIGNTGEVTINNLSGNGEQVVMADNTGLLKKGSISATSLVGTGNLTGTGITVGNGTGATLKPVTLEITNGAITAEKLNAMGATNGQILKYNNGTWAPANENTTTVGVLQGDITGEANNTTVAKLQTKNLNIQNIQMGDMLHYNGTEWVNRNNRLYVNGQDVFHIQYNLGQQEQNVKKYITDQGIVRIESDGDTMYSRRTIYNLSNRNLFYCKSTPLSIGAQTIMTDAEEEVTRLYGTEMKVKSVKVIGSGTPNNFQIHSWQAPLYENITAITGELLAGEVIWKGVTYHCIGYAPIWQQRYQ